MKKSILNLGKVLNKTEQQIINGGTPNSTSWPSCITASDCKPTGEPVTCAQGKCIYAWNA